MSARQLASTEGYVCPSLIPPVPESLFFNFRCVIAQQARCYDAARKELVPGGVNGEVAAI